MSNAQTAAGASAALLETSANPGDLHRHPPHRHMTEDEGASTLTRLGGGRLRFRVTGGWSGVSALIGLGKVLGEVT